MQRISFPAWACTRLVLANRISVFICPSVLLCLESTASWEPTPPLTLQSFCPFFTGALWRLIYLWSSFLTNSNINLNHYSYAEYLDFSNSRAKLVWFLVSTGGSLKTFSFCYHCCLPRIICGCGTLLWSQHHLWSRVVMNPRHDRFPHFIQANSSPSPSINSTFLQCELRQRRFFFYCLNLVPHFVPVRVLYVVASQCVALCLKQLRQIVRVFQKFYLGPSYNFQ